ncbi:MAG: adenylate/guanylate cyclase domain-containing protein [Spirochaetales bacterium]
MEHKDYRLAAIMFTDIVGFSRMMEEDEPGTLKTLDFHNKLVREQVEKYRGSVIKTIGDAFLAQFSTTLDAVHCSLAVQNAIQEYNEAKIGKPLTLRIGVHLGDIYFYENDALGEGINIASRLQSATKPGHITISREVYSQVSGKIPMKVESMGQVHLKNITREVHAYEIIPGGEDNNSSQFLRSKKAAEVPESVPESEPETETDSAPQPEPRAAPTGGPPPNFRDLREEWKNLRSHIRVQVEEQVERQLGDSDRSGRDAWRDNRRQLRHQFEGNPGEFLESFFQDPLSKLKNEDGTPASAFQIYRQKKLRKIEKEKRGWQGHLRSFVLVNAFLIFLCYLTQGSGLAAYPWFVYPLFGWGIGLASHRAAYKNDKRNAWELEQIDELGDEDYRALRKFQETRGSFQTHLVSNAAVSVLLGVIWFVNGGSDFPWPLIPIAAMGLGVMGRLGSYGEAKKSFKAVWARISGKGVRPAGHKSAPVVPTGEPEDPVVAKARSLRDSILAQAQGIKGGNPFGEDMTLTLDNYVKQISELSSIEREIGRVVSSFGVTDLAAEEVVLRRKIEASTSATLKVEYEKSLSEIDKQKKSFDDLSEQQEILGLRITSSVKNLQQMQIDLARIKGLSDGQKEGYFLTIKDRSEELSRYLEDYREGLKESSD